MAGAKSRPKWLTKSPLELDLVFFDLETTGGNPQNSGVTEVAAIKYRNGKEVGRFSTLVNPGRPIPHIVRKITGINDDMVKGAPPMEDVIGEFTDFIGENSVLVAHGVLSDISFVSHYVKKVFQKEFHHFYVCTHLLVSNFFAQIPSKTLSGVADYFGIKASNVHRAMDDAEITASVFWKIYEKLQTNGHHSIESLCKLQGDQKTLHKLGSGVTLFDVYDSAPSAPGVFYLMSAERELIFLSASPNIRQSLLDLTKLGEHREWNLLMTDVSDFRVVRTPSYLAALVREHEELRKLHLPIDPRKLYPNRLASFLQVMVPKDLEVYFPTSNYNANLVEHDLHLSNRLRSPDPEALEEAIEQEGNAANKPEVRHSKTILSLIRSQKYMVNWQRSANTLEFGSCKTGTGWVFGPFFSGRNALESAEKLMAYFPFHNADLTTEARLRHLSNFLKVLDGRLHQLHYMEGAERLEQTSSLKPFVKLISFIERTIAGPTQKELEAIAKLAKPFSSATSLRSGIAVFSNKDTKEFELFVVVRGHIRSRTHFPFEQSDKMRSSRFISRMFYPYHKELMSPEAVPYRFDADACSHIEFFTHWFNQRGEDGEWLDFKDIRALYKPETLQ